MILSIAIFIILGLLFGNWEGIMYYNPFKGFFSREYYNRLKTTILDKYFPIDGGHILKQLIVILVSFLPNIFGDFPWYLPILNYTSLSLTFNGILELLKYIAKKKDNERQNI